MRKCLYCHGHNRVLTRHISSCPFNPKNNRLIIDFLKSLVVEDEAFTITKYDDFAKINGTPTSKTILDLFISNSFIPPDSTTKHAFIYLIYRSYELNLIDELELLDLLVYRITFGMYGLTYEEYSKRSEQIAIKAGIEIDDINIQYEFLARTVLDEEFDA